MTAEDLIEQFRDTLELFIAHTISFTEFKSKTTEALNEYRAELGLPELKE